MTYEITAFDLKLALLQYFRFQRQWVCVDEFRGADVIADTGKDIIEVEVKVDKGDLIKKEQKKRKHHFYRMGRSCGLFNPNRFYFCVPETLVELAQGVCDSLNPKYGIIAFNPYVFERHIQWNYRSPHQKCLRMARSAKRLYESYAKCQEAIAMRTSSKIVSLMEYSFKRNLQETIGDKT